MKAKFPNIPGIYPGIHHKKLKSHFKQFKTAESTEKLRHTCKKNNVFLVCFTNRSGSNLVCQAISSSGQVKQPEENLNFTNVIKISEKRHFNDYAEYLHWLIETKSRRTGNVGIKVSPDQLIQLFNYGLLRQMGDIKLIMISRTDN